MHNQKTSWVSRVKLIYARINLTRYTTLYFFLALFSCITLSALQSAAYFNNTDGSYAVAKFVDQANINTTTVGMSFLQDGNVMLCHNIPGEAGAKCSTLVKTIHSHMHVRDLALTLDERESPDLEQCALSLMWLGDVLDDARREDLVILTYQIWLFTMSVMTLLNESLPHLFAGFAARLLATAWGGFRVQGNINLYTTYLNVITTGKCNGFDPMGDWWSDSAPNEVAVLISNTINLVLMGALSYKLFQVYASQTFSRVGASPEVNRIYKLVLLLSVGLQLAGFFTLSQMAMWIAKISFGAIRQLAEHFPIYLGVLIVTSVLSIPWLVLGWISVRRESKALFILFAGISLILFLMATGMFISPLYRFVLREWSFYATMSVTAYILLVATSVLAIICRLQFGKGLAHFLQVSAALDDGDFTPVYFSKGAETPGDDASEFEKKSSGFDTELPTLKYTSSTDNKGPKIPEPVHQRKLSSLSVIFLKDSKTIKLSSSSEMFRNATEDKRISSAPVVVQPVVRTTSIPPMPSRPKAKPPLNINTTVPVLPKINVSPMRYQHTRSETVDARPSREREPTKPQQAAVRSRSVPRRPSNESNASRTSPVASKPAGNFF
ncbi:hypothetical protein C8F04DRAFT_1080663 [Mycena alexandri]|uniref:Uncharacterized protein n=1 Tax=Mycena alexandri TaxID=1745969 RepID=A0AAD6XAE3_9AGAR|nr:hypothetical protein C8F04DRAFT_1080663 [Mycena alexandri]